MKPTGVNYGPSKPIIIRVPASAAPAGGVSTAGKAAGGYVAMKGGGAGVGEKTAGDGTPGNTGGKAKTGNTGGKAKTGNAGVEAVAGKAGDGRKYMAAKVMSASPLELILIMYEQFFELIPDIKSNIAKNSPGEVEPDAERAQAIVDELINALDFDVELSKDLGAVYYYVRDRILESNVKFDPAIWDGIESVMRPLYEGFKSAAKQVETPRDDPLKSKSTQIVAGITYGQNNLKEVVINTRSGLKV
jgi:flagellar protein FliS